MEMERVENFQLKAYSSLSLSLSPSSSFTFIPTVSLFDDLGARGSIDDSIDAMLLYSCPK